MIFTLRFAEFRERATGRGRAGSDPDETMRAIVGISMGGFGAIKLALQHPELFILAGGISSAIDVPRRTFSSSACSSRATTARFLGRPGA
jgi:S-formylglutathione hydrolase FrmB